MAGNGALLGGLKKSAAAFRGPCFLAYGHAMEFCMTRLDSRNGIAAYLCRRRFRYGVADGTRTRDSQDHNLVLYQLNYSHHCRAKRRERS